MANLANPTVIVNGATIEIVPNTWRYKSGRGDTTVRTNQAGQNVRTVKNVDAETQMSMAAFTMITTAQNIALVEEWLALRSSGGVSIEAFDEDNSLGFQGMVITTEPEYVGGAEGTIELEFQGDPI